MHLNSHIPRPPGKSSWRLTDYTGNTVKFRSQTQENIPNQPPRPHAEGISLVHRFEWGCYWDPYLRVLVHGRLLMLAQLARYGLVSQYVIYNNSESRSTKWLRPPPCLIVAIGLTRRFRRFESVWKGYPNRIYFFSQHIPEPWKRNQKRENL